MRLSGLPVEALIRYVSLFQQGDATLQARKSLLVEQRDALAGRIRDMQGTLDRLNGKIERYEKTILPIENELKKQGE